MRKDYILPQAEHLAGATVIQQMGLDSQMGMQRLLMILLDKLDPEGKGVTLTLQDLNHAIHSTLTERRSEMLIRGESDQILLQLCTPEQIAVHREHELSRMPTRAQ